MVVVNWVVVVVGVVQSDIGIAPLHRFGFAIRIEFAVVVLNGGRGALVVHMGIQAQAAGPIRV